jgi:hypothetical protein
MTSSSELYWAKAADMAARAKADTTHAGTAEYARLCLGYVRLAQRAERSSQTDVIHGNAQSYYWHRRALRHIHVLLQHTGLRRNDARH